MFKIVFDEVFQVAPKDVNFSKIFVNKIFFFLESCSKLFVVTNTNLSSFAEKVLPSWNNPCPPVVRSPFWLPDFHLVSLVRFCLVGGQSLLHWPVQGGPLNNPPVKLQTPWKSSSPDSVHTRVHTSQSRWSFVLTKPERPCITADRILNMLSFSNTFILYSFCSYLPLSAVVFVRNLSWKP